MKIGGEKGNIKNEELSTNYTNEHEWDFIRYWCVTQRTEMYVLTEAFGGLSEKNPVRGGPGSFP